MAHQAQDYAYARDFLQKINEVEWNGLPLKNAFYYDGYNLWQSQQDLMFRDIRFGFSGTKTYSPPRYSLYVRIKEYILITGLIVWTCISYLVLILYRKKMLIYAVDQGTKPYLSDFRLHALYTVLPQERSAYMEVFHTRFQRDTVTNFFKRRRFCLYIDVLSWIYYIMRDLRLLSRPDLSPLEYCSLTAFITDDEKKFARDLIERYVLETKAAAFKMRVWRKMLQYSHVKLLFAIDDPRIYSELMYGASVNNIPSYALQHGHFTSFHMGWLKIPGAEGKIMAPDYLVVWSEFWRKELLRLGTYFTPEQLIVGGFKEVLPPQIPPLKDVWITILVPYETVAPKAEIAKYLEEFLQEANVRIFFKPRPDEPYDKQLAEYNISALAVGERCQVINNINKALPEIDAVVGVYSTLLYDMLGLYRRAIILRTSMTYGQDMVISGLADMIDREKGESAAQLLTLINKPHEEVVERHNQVFGENSKTLSTTILSLMQTHL